MSTWIRTNQGVAACVALVALGLGAHLLASDWAFQRLRDGFYLGAFTLMANFAVLLCALSIMLDGRRRDVEDDMAITVWSDWAIAAGILAACLVYFHLAWAVDFLLVTAPAMAAATYGLGVRPLRSALLAGLVITAGVYGLFRLIGIPLPTNLLGL